MKKITHAAFIVSVHYEASDREARINLKWKGDYQISDFQLDRLGRILHCETETENAGWVLVRFSPPLHRSSAQPLSQFGPAIITLSEVVRPGDAVPLQSSL
jgi:hypothetical protein